MKKIFSLLLICNLFFITKIFAEEEKEINFSNDISLSAIVTEFLSDNFDNNDIFQTKFRETIKCYLEEKNYKKAYNNCKYIIKKDTNKERISTCKYLLSDMYFMGEYVKKDYNKSFSLLEEILKENDSSYILYSKVLYSMGYMLFFGKGVDIDFNRSISLMEESASLGNEEAITFLDNIERDNIDEYNLGEKIYGLPNLTLFSKKENNLIKTIQRLEVFQVLVHNIALANMGYFPDTIIVLIIGNNDDYFYDNQKVKTPPGKKIKQIGIYKYETKDGNFKTVPAVAIK